MATTTNIVEQWQVAPSPGAAATEQLLPLLYTDTVFICQNYMEHAFFYSLPSSSCSQPHFMETIVPRLKSSLSLTLKHFIPLAGKIIFPLTTGMPVSQYVNGDSVSLAVAVSDADFNQLTGNLPRDADQFHDFFAPLPPATYFPDFIKFSIAAVQVTLFPNKGMCIGITQHHAIGDGSTFMRFLDTWASINKFNGDDAHLLAPGQSCLSFYGRSGILGGGNESLGRACWDLVKMLPPIVYPTNPVPTHKVRATFVLSGGHVQELINYFRNERPSGTVSSLSLVCALVWTSLARSAAAAGDVVDDDEVEYFSCVADIRARLNPRLPNNYFGNCLAVVVAELTHGKLKGDQGIVVAAESIGEAIKKTVNNENGVLDGIINRVRELLHIKMIGKRILSIAGSPRFDVYSADFGWGGPKKGEVVQIDNTRSVCLLKSRELDGGVEIGLSMPQVKMDAFAANFTQGLVEATNITYNQVSKM